MSPFLTIPPTAHVAANDLAFAVRDRFPVSAGHTLIITRRVVPDFFACSDAEKAALLELVDQVKADLDRTHRPDGYNVGFNAGVAAGQTVMHVHVHVIPRYHQDVEDPRGGVRYVIPDKANYLRSREDPLTDGERHADGAPRNLMAALGPHLSRATVIDVLAAFVQDSGLTVVENALRSAVACDQRRARVRVLTGDYLDITAATALRTLLDWAAAADEGAGSIETRVVEHAAIGRAFHPKAWRVEGPGFGLAFLGSSNLSASALVQGVEWNLAVERHRDALAYGRVVDSFEQIWRLARPLDASWVDAYARRPRRVQQELPPPEPWERLQPTSVQETALTALAQARADGCRRTLVVMATGLGKTLLAVFDLQQLGAQLGRMPRVLWVAHRRELLDQAAASMRRVFPHARLAWWQGGPGPTEAWDVVFGSVLTLARPPNLARLDAMDFDVVVVDEAHHAEAASYRRVMAEVKRAFVLGLTATPDRGDGSDVVGLFDDHVAFRADLGVGICDGHLVPFSYFGLKDPTNFAAVPWRNGGFDPAALATALATQVRMDRLWEAWNEADKAASRTLVFCASISHGAFVRDWLAERGVRVALVHGGAGSDDRFTALSDLEAGRLDAVCSVDLFNEGVDCRPIDRVVMLRPTESPVLFLQQLGRGLRRATDKARLVVLDFVGNHRVFLDRVRGLISLMNPTASVAAFLERRVAVLPTGCSVDVEIEAIDLLKKLLPQGSSVEALRVYRELRAARGVRPQAGELVRRGFNPLRLSSEGWLGLVAAEHDLSADEVAARTALPGWWTELETTALTKSFKLVVLSALLEHDALFAGMDLDRLAERCHALLLRSPELFADLEGVKAIGEPRAPTGWRSYWDTNPVAAWTRGRWFRREGGALQFTGQVDEALRPVVVALTAELVDARLAQYRRRREVASGDASFVARVFHSGGDPILKLPNAREGLPNGETDVLVDGGAVWRFRFAKIAINVARPLGSDRNALADLLRGWFGLAAGKPGTDFRVRFRKTPDGWFAEPLGEVVQLARGRFPAYPSLRAAAGPEGGGDELPAATEVALPGETASGRFAVRVAGDSMAGGPNPLHDGDWVILELCRGLGIGAVRGRVVLVAVEQPGGGTTHHLKRVVERADGWALASDNPAVADLPADGATVIARFVSVVRPESLAPPEGEALADSAVADAFGVSEPPRGEESRCDGHLFLRLEGGARFDGPDRARGAAPNPGETAFVLVRPDLGAPWTYLGVGRFADGRWAFPPPTRALWSELSAGRSASRTLPVAYAQVAEAFAASLPVGASFVSASGTTWRVAERKPGGSVIVDGGGQARPVTLTDIGWVLRAREAGGVLDEAAVNRHRYLDGTAKASTRWVDTGIAIGLVRTFGGRDHGPK
jgi:superfamily II DNA or RNA helicase/diadenosine tetraphosphate (Ap4A) HIT family hydrolase/HKD family nuclease